MLTFNTKNKVFYKFYTYSAGVCVTILSLDIFQSIEIKMVDILCVCALFRRDASTRMNLMYKRARAEQKKLLLRLSRADLQFACFVMLRRVFRAPRTTGDDQQAQTS